MARWAKLTIVCGKRGTGKTNRTLRLLYRAVNMGKKVLIFDVMDEFGDYLYREDAPRHNISPIFIKDIPRFTAQTKAEIRRIRPFLDDSRRMKINDMQNALAYILDTYKGGILLIEDINKYVTDNPTRDVMGALATLRQSHVDLMAHYQLIGKAGNPKLLGMCNYIRMHKTEDEVSRHEDKFIGKTKILSIAEIIVNERYRYGMDNDVNDETGKFFSCTVDLEYSKIKGIFTEEEAENAIAEYISMNSKNTINQLLNKRDRTGKPVWQDYASAYSFMERDMKADYFGKFD